MAKKNTSTKKAPNKGKKKVQKKKNEAPRFNLYWIYGIIAFFMISMLFTNDFEFLKSRDGSTNTHLRVP